MENLALELLNALDDLDKVEADFKLNMLMHQEYKDRRNKALHRIDKARAALRKALKK
jgi:hypothetical protein